MLFGPDSQRNGAFAAEASEQKIRRRQPPASITPSTPQASHLGPPPFFEFAVGLVSGGVVWVGISVNVNGWVGGGWPGIGISRLYTTY